MFVSNIEQFSRWGGVWYANGVDPACGHFFEIIIDLLKIAVFVPFLIRLKRTIADAFDVDFLVADENELATDNRSCRNGPDHRFRRELRGNQNIHGGSSG